MTAMKDIYNSQVKDFNVFKNKSMIPSTNSYIYDYKVATSTIIQIKSHYKNTGA